MADQKIKRGAMRRPDIDTLYSINPDGSHNVLQPADVKGRWQLRKKILFAVLIVFYLALPWIPIGGHPAVLIDIPGRHGYFFGGSYTREDFYLLFFVLTGFGFALFAATALWGRVWCGYACPQTVFLEGVYRRVERWIEGKRTVRMRRNKGPWTFEKIWRKSVKQALFILLSLALAHSFLAYFIPVGELAKAMRSSPAEHPSAFGWMAGIAALAYFDFAWFREQLCLIICPYGRLQSAMIDEETVLIGYDESRGEPRGPKGKAAGDCIDCFSCVAVCPTGIDIRNGLQMECIGCANCIDACDHMMRQLGRPEGLVRYDSLRGFAGGKRRFLRPRLFLYASLSVVGLVFFLITAGARAPFEANALRARGMPYVLEETRIRNLYTIHIQNKSTEEHSYAIEPIDPGASGHPRVDFEFAQDEVTLAGLAGAKVALFAFVARSDYRGPFALSLRVTERDSGLTQEVKLRFRGP